MAIATCVRALPNTSRAVMTNGAAVPTVIGDTRAPEIVHWALQVSAGSMTNAAAFETRGEPSLPHATEHAILIVHTPMVNSELMQR